MSEYCKNCEELLKRATVAEDNFACEVQARLYHQTKWLEYSEECEKYKHALEEIEEKIKEINGSKILTFPDLSLQENAKAIMGQCNEGYRKILDIISKAREG